MLLIKKNSHKQRGITWILMTITGKPIHIMRFPYALCVTSSSWVSYLQNEFPCKKYFEAFHFLLFHHIRTNILNDFVIFTFAFGSFFLIRWYFGSFSLCLGCFTKSTGLVFPRWFWKCFGLFSSRQQTETWADGVSTWYSKSWRSNQQFCWRWIHFFIVLTLLTWKFCECFNIDTNIHVDEFVYLKQLSNIKWLKCLI